MSAARGLVFGTLCVVVGPPIGAAMAVGILALQAVAAGQAPAPSEVLNLALQGMLWSHVLVWLTALATGVIGGLVLTLVRPFALRLAIVPIIGTAATGLGVPLTTDILMGPGFAPIMLVTGALISTGCLLLAEGLVRTKESG